MKKETRNLRFGAVIALCALALIIATALPAGDSIASEEASKHPHYRISAAFDPTDMTITAHMTVSFYNASQEHLKELHFRLYQNRKPSRDDIEPTRKLGSLFNVDPYPADIRIYPDALESGDLTVEKVKSAGRNLSCNISGGDSTVFVVELPQSLAPGQTTEIEMDFAVTIPERYGPFGYYRDIATLNRWYPMLSVLEDGKWIDPPVSILHQPFISDAARYDVNITVPAGFEVAHSGSLIKTKDNGNRTITKEISSGLIRDFSFSVSNKYKVAGDRLGNIRIYSYYLSGDQEGGVRAAGYARDAIEYYISKYGSYPYSQFTVAESYLGAGGYESSNIIYIDTRAYHIPGMIDRHLDFLVSHETGHQWYYNQVGSNGYSETWLDEGLAAHMTLMYLENKYGTEDNYLVLPKFLKWLPNTSFRNAMLNRYLAYAKADQEEAILQPMDSFENTEELMAMAYSKGLFVLEMLRIMLGDEMYFSTMQKYLEEYRYRNATVNDFVALVERESGKDLAWFFDGWLHSTQTCDFAVDKVCKKRSGGEYGYEIVVSRTGEAEMPAKILIELENGETITREISKDLRQKKIVVETDSELSRVTIDPAMSLLETDRTNNQYPRKRRVRLTPLHFFPFDMALLTPPDSQVITAGPNISSDGLGGKISTQELHDSQGYVQLGIDPNDGGTVKSTIGYELYNRFGSNNTLGAKITYDDGGDDGDDLLDGQIYLTHWFRQRSETYTPLRRRMDDFEAPPTAGIGQILDNATVFVRRQRDRDEREDDFDAASIGIIFLRDRSIYEWDPVGGYRVSFGIEKGEKVLGADDAFTRAFIEAAAYRKITANGRLALRVGGGLGEPDHRDLFELGGANNLRGYSRNDADASSYLLGSLEYTHTIFKDLNLRAIDNIFTLDTVSAAAFVDSGYLSLDDDEDFLYDVGVGVRLDIQLFGFLERGTLSLDVAEGLATSEDFNVWVKFGQPF